MIATFSHWKAISSIFGYEQANASEVQLSFYMSYYTKDT